MHALDFISIGFVQGCILLYIPEYVDIFLKSYGDFFLSNLFCCQNIGISLIIFVLKTIKNYDPLRLI